MTSNATNNQRKSRRTLLLVLAAFILPIVLAKLALDNQWFNYGVTNQGQLLEQPLTLEEIGLEKSEIKQWFVIYSLPDNCDEHCQQTLMGIEHAYLALGRETPRVTPIALSNSPFNAEQLQYINDKHWRVIDTPVAAQTTLSSSQIYVADPLGNIVLTYTQPASIDDIPAFGKAMLSDLKKLLKYSRIG